ACLRAAARVRLMRAQSSWRSASSGTSMVSGCRQANEAEEAEAEEEEDEEDEEEAAGDPPAGASSAGAPSRSASALFGSCLGTSTRHAVHPLTATRLSPAEEEDGDTAAAAAAAADIAFADFVRCAAFPRSPGTAASPPLARGTSV
ncbi:hypothetical protein EV177_010489, partial [Coemansia sp. RSA 1804]